MQSSTEQQDCVCPSKSNHFNGYVDGGSQKGQQNTFANGQSWRLDSSLCIEVNQNLKAVRIYSLQSPEGIN